MSESEPVFRPKTHVLKLSNFQKEGLCNTMAKICDHYSPISSSKEPTAIDFRNCLMGKAECPKILKTVIHEIQTAFDNQGPKASSVPFVRVKGYRSFVINGILTISGSQ